MVNLIEMRRLIDKELPRAQHSVELAMAKATKCTAAINGMPRGSVYESQVERGAELLEMARSELERIETIIREMRIELKPRIDALDSPNERRVLMLRYMYGLSCDEVADVMGYCKRHTMRIMRRAEDHLGQDVIECHRLSV